MSDEWPDWKDLGRKVTATYADGRVVTGKLGYTDMTPGPDESPLFVIETDTGEESFFDAETWAFVTE
ncbi:hypothetical protein EA658_09880 [Pseudoxanthomonas winnipegensis]|uniref:Uncharacterized protein n=1 Tax=Pseudoxanthomonas winnipegensis TaxID=2480810 RepID=A0ABY1WCT8_9GAMM|nr:hypothetical protein [Pseudoxanthomonas winnipegensis]TAA12457.1 hypothetical protein EA659_03770 [Pseudoxanthomonas winnipegensis]TAA19178.1 hypothetical protein EA658_09880 [Pseudoxanthomonas winnipegensis]TAH70439.1 hypothetical protein EA657_16945 [Pseudoxanthomonas winnipegensis]